MNGFGRIGQWRFAGKGEGTSRSAANPATARRSSRLVRLIAVLMAACGIGILAPSSAGLAEELVKGEPPAPGRDAADAAKEAPAQAPAMAELSRLRISSQTWRRGGLGSKALVTITLRNDNDYAVKDVEIACAFLRRDGSLLTNRSRVLAEAVAQKSRKTFARIPVGFVNVNADQARCSLTAARRA